MSAPHHSDVPRRPRARANRTLVLSDADRQRLRPSLLRKAPQTRFDAPPCGIVVGDYRHWCPLLPRQCVDLLFLDPPYNLRKTFYNRQYARVEPDEYTRRLDASLALLVPLLAPTATVYICGDWRTSLSIFAAASRHLIVRNRITWERDKGRGARRNWKNACEDIWFCTVSDRYTFEVERVKLRRRVLAPYRDAAGRPRDWQQNADERYRDTHPSNLWTDITVPFWSMPENTDHPAQKSEKLLARLVLASSNPGDFILDPFAGSGTTAVVAQKLGRRCLGIELEEEYALMALRRMELAESRPAIQGLADGVFWERNTLRAQRQSARSVEPKHAVDGGPATETGVGPLQPVRNDRETG